jgi:hypothetical protein
MTRELDANQKSEKTVSTTANTLDGTTKKSKHECCSTNYIFYNIILFCIQSMSVKFMSDTNQVKVMIQHTRGCGVRKVGGLYLYCSPGVAQNCYRLPMPLPEACPCCGEEIRFLRSVRMINPKKMWGDCNKTVQEHACHAHKCYVCFPPEKAGLMWVGKEYTPDQFVKESFAIGTSKRVPRIPKTLKIGDRLFLAHHNALPEIDEHGIPNLERDGIFFATTITEFHQIVSEKQAQDEEFIDKLVTIGITPVLEVTDESSDELKAKVVECDCGYIDVDKPQKSLSDFD